MLVIVFTIWETNFIFIYLYRWLELLLIYVVPRCPYGMLWDSWRMNSIQLLNYDHMVRE